MPSPNERHTRILHSILTGGATLAGAYAGLSAVRWWYRRTLPPPSLLPPALDWETSTMETEHGRSTYYARPGTGTPIILLHSFSPPASSYDVKPIAEHLSSVTDRPIFALDWLGFGRSDRPDVRYTPDIYGRQLYQLLSERLDGPADIVAVGLGCEYAAWMALQASPLVRRLTLISPTGLTAVRRGSRIGQVGLSLAEMSGVFDLTFYRLTGPDALRGYYANKVFLDEEKVPDHLLDYATRSARVKGAPHAPYSVLKEDLHLEDAARELYGRLYRRTLFVTPATPRPTHRSFDLLPRVLNQNSRNVTHATVSGGLMPQWEDPQPFFEALDGFLLEP